MIKFHVTSSVDFCNIYIYIYIYIYISVGQGTTALAVGAGGVCLDIFSPGYHFCLLARALWETVRYRLKYCLKGPLNP